MNHQEPYRERIEQGLSQLELNIPQATIGKLLDFLILLQKWNRKFNLTAIKEIEEMIPNHLFDSLSIAPFLQGVRILDVGTGAGFPGVPLALCFPEKKFVLLDSTGKKIQFLIHAKALLKIHNIEPIQSRVESYKPHECFDTLVFRAVGAMDEFIKKTQHLCCEQGEFLFMKGIYPEKELPGVKKLPITIHPLQVPLLNAERHLVVIKNNAF